MASAVWAQDPDDGDGFPDEIDLCPGTPAGHPAVVYGCPTVDAVPVLERMLDFSLGGLKDSLGVVRGVVGLEKDADAIEKRVDKLYGKTREIFGSGRFCKAAKGAGKLTATLQKSRDLLDRRIAGISAAAGGTPFEVPSGEEGDTTSADRRIVDAAVARHKFGKASDAFAADLGSVTPFCSTLTGRSRETGRIVRVLDSKRQVELDSGMLLVLGNRAPRSAIYAGALIEWKGATWGNGTGVAEMVIPQGTLFIPGTLELECMGLRILPVQPLPPYSGGPFIMHRPDAYKAPQLNDGQNLFLEYGMGAAVVNDFGCDVPDAPPGMHTRISAELVQERYQRPDIVLAADLMHGDPPVRLPDYGYMTQLRMTVRRQLCHDTAPGETPVCEPPVDIRTDVYPTRLESNLEPCEDVAYESEVFSVDDANPNAFDDARIANVELAFESIDKPLGGGVSNVVFSAEGYRLVLGSIPSYPSVTTVTEADKFAIFNLDREFYDVASIYPFLEKEVTGVDKASGLRWPRVTGIRNGLPFRYSCPLPRISRDRLAECAEGTPDTFYKLPFEGGAPTWRLAQGNNGTFTHNGSGQYAFDFVAPALTPILAARGGIVIGVRETSTGSCYCKAPACATSMCVNCTAPNNGNFVVVEHEDGTTARYIHMPEDGVVVEPGDEVRRGDLIGYVGSTGCSTDPHVHFEVNSAPGAATIPASFTSTVPGDLQCYVPNTGNPVESTNTQNP